MTRTHLTAICFEPKARAGLTVGLLFLGACGRQDAPKEQALAPIPVLQGAAPVLGTESDALPEKAVSSAMSAAQYGPFDYTLPDGFTVTIRPDLLGPGYAINVGFLVQFDPHAVRDEKMLESLSPYERRLKLRVWESMEKNAASTNPVMLDQIYTHLETAHGLSRAKVEEVRARCEAMLRRAAVMDQAVDFTP